MASWRLQTEIWNLRLSAHTLTNGDEVAILDYFQNKGSKVMHQRSPVPGYEMGGWCGAAVEEGGMKVTDGRLCKRCSTHRHGWRENDDAYWGWERVPNPYDKKVTVAHPTPNPHMKGK